jgi:ubiquinone/menaquinone biosynthesis C-methylase UbiE/uncharacterized protein YbaR (Trm112 family)
MERTTLDLLACPDCHPRSTLQETDGPSLIETGYLSCFTRQMTYPIQDGIARFVSTTDLEGYNKTFAHLYNWFSFIYSEFSKTGFRLLVTTEAKARRELLARLEPPGGRVLEVSIGPGVNLPFLFEASTVKEVYGLDIHTGQLKRCRTLMRRKGWSVELFLGNGEQLLFAEATFDSVFHIGGIKFFNDQQKTITEMIRVAKPGMKLIICDENESGARWYERFLPAFKGAFRVTRQSVTSPIELILQSMIDV